MALLSGMMVIGTAGTARAADGDEECVPSAAATIFEWSVGSPGEGFSQTGESRFVETAPAVVAVPELSYTEYEYSWVEVTQEYVPAVYGATEYKFVNTQNSNLPPRWSTDPNWNANGNRSSQGWQSTGETNEPILEEEVPEETVTHTDWFAQDPGDPWEPTGESETVVTQEGVDGKDAEGYTEYEWVRSIPAVVCGGVPTPGEEPPSEEPPGEEPPGEEPPVEGETPPVEPPVVGGVEAETPVNPPTVKGVQAEAPAGKPVVKGVSAQAPASGKARTSVQVPLAVDAGLGAPSAGGTATASLLGQGLMGGGLMLLLLAGWTRKGQLPRGAHQV